MTDWQPDIVIYHHPCADGFGAAWAIHTRWPDAVYVPANYGQEPPDVTGKRVLIVDFSYKEPVLRAMGERALSVVVLDHHKTAMADLEAFGTDANRTVDIDRFRATVEHYEGSPAFPANIFAFFDMNRSGAVLAWDFARPGEKAPYMLRLIQDRDLWRFNMPESKAFATWLRTQTQDFETWDWIAKALAGRSASTIMIEAHAMQGYHDQIVRQIAGGAETISTSTGDIAVPVVNCPGMFASDVGHELLQRHPQAPYSMTYSDEGERRKFSLRSDDSRADVSAIAQQFGGGGHRNAAGFTVPSPHLLNGFLLPEMG